MSLSKKSISDGLVLYTSFEDSFIIGNILKDQSGQGNDGTLIGKPDFGSGIKGKSLSIENPATSAGSATITADQYVDFGKPNSLQFGTGSFSISFWMKTTKGGQNKGALMGNKNYASGNNKGFAFGTYTSNGVSDIRFNFSATGTSRVEIVNTLPVDDKWHHIVVVFDREGDLVSYIDGRESGRDDKMKEHIGINADTGLSFIIGADGSPKYGMAGAKLDELRVYKKAVDAATIEELYVYDGVYFRIDAMRNEIGKIYPSTPENKVILENGKKQIAIIRAKVNENSTPEECIAYIAEVTNIYNELMALEPGVPLLGDVYVRGGSHEEEPAVKDVSLVVKKVSDPQNDTRKSLIKMDISNYTAEIYSAVLEIEFKAKPANEFIYAMIYLVENSWNEDTVTFKTFPKRIIEEEITLVTKYMAGHWLKQNVDVTIAVNRALSMGQKEISFEISIPDGPTDNYMSFYSSRAEQNKPARLRIIPSFEPNVEFEAARAKYKKYVLGGDLNETIPGVSSYIEKLNGRANKNWAEMIPTEELTDRVWEDLDMSFVAGNGSVATQHSGNVTATYVRIYDMAKAYFTKGTDLYQNNAVKIAAIEALDYMYENHFNENDRKTPHFGNWFHWEISAPFNSLSTAILFYEDLTSTQIRNYVAAVTRYTPVCDVSSGYGNSPTIQTGANLMDKGTSMALAALLVEDPARMEHVNAAFREVFLYVKQGDGFYRDGSYVQHKALGYMGGYGSTLYSKIGLFFIVFNSSPWAIQYEDDSQKVIFDMLFKAVAPFFHDGRYMDMIAGRDITRKNSMDRTRGVALAGSTLPIIDSIDDAVQKANYKSIMKAVIAADEPYFVERLNINALVAAHDIMNDTSVIPRTDYTFNQQFAGMDRHVYATKDYSLGLALNSTRTYGHERHNDEGQRTWNTSDGQTYIYTADKTEFSEGYWATVDPTRLPGTTVEHVVHANGAGRDKYNVYDWVGGATVNMIGSVGMHYKAFGTNGNRNGADVEKSWFLFGDEVVAIGTGITTTTGRNIETIIDNRKIDIKAETKVFIDGNEVDILTTTATPKPFVNPKWIYIDGQGAADGIGYYFPDAITVQAMKEVRIDDWINQGSTAGEAINGHAALWIDHGRNPTNSTYAYVLVPAKSKNIVQNLAENSDTVIVRKFNSVHAATKPSIGATAVNFWKKSTVAELGMTSDKPASIVMEEANGFLTIGITDPTQKEMEPINIEIVKKYVGVIIADDNILVDISSKDIIKISVRAFEVFQGSTSKVTFKL